MEPLAGQQGGIPRPIFPNSTFTAYTIACGILVFPVSCSECTGNVTISVLCMEANLAQGAPPAFEATEVSPVDGD